MPWASIQAGSVRTRSSSCSVLRLFEESDHPAVVVDPHDAQARGLRGVDRHGRDGHVGPGLLVRGDHLAEVHPIELVAGEDQHVVDVGLLEVAEVLPHGVGRALVPVGVVDRLLGGQDLDESAVEGVEVVAAADVPVQADRVELGQHVDPVQPAVDAVRQGDVDQPVLAGHRHGRLGADLGQRIEPGPLAAAQDQRECVLHAMPRSIC